MLRLLVMLSTLVAASSVCEERQTPPVVDLSLLLDGDTNSDSFQNISQSIRDACKDWGFFQITHHGIRPELFLEMQREMLWFFALPLEEKLKFKRNATNPRGFAHDELTKQVVDYKEILDYGFGFGELDGVNHLPDSPSFQRTLRTYYEANVKLSHALIDVFSHSLGIGLDPFRDAFRRHSSFARLNYYPPFHGAETTAPLGVSRHTDAGGLTILWQESPGLQVYSGTKQDANDGEWVDLNVISGAVVVNVGDMMEVWTGGRCRAAEHRVVIKEGKLSHRLSVPFFFNPDYEAVITPLTGRRKFRPFTWGRFRSARFKGDFADLGQESQIEDYEI